MEKLAGRKEFEWMKDSREIKRKTFYFRSRYLTCSQRFLRRLNERNMAAVHPEAPPARSLRQIYFLQVFILKLILSRRLCTISNTIGNFRIYWVSICLLQLIWVIFACALRFTTYVYLRCCLVLCSYFNDERFIVIYSLRRSRAKLLCAYLAHRQNKLFIRHA